MLIDPELGAGFIERRADGGQDVGLIGGIAGACLVGECDLGKAREKRVAHRGRVLRLEEGRHDRDDVVLADDGQIAACEVRALAR